MKNKIKKELEKAAMDWEAQIAYQRAYFESITAGIEAFDRKIELALYPVLQLQKEARQEQVRINQRAIEIKDLFEKLPYEEKCQKYFDEFGAIWKPDKNILNITPRNSDEHNLYHYYEIEWWADILTQENIELLLDLFKKSPIPETFEENALIEWSEQLEEEHPEVKNYYRKIIVYGNDFGDNTSDQKLQALVYVKLERFLRDKRLTEEGGQVTNYLPSNLETADDAIEVKNNKIPVRAIALICLFQQKPVTKNNAGKIVKEPGFNHKESYGQKLLGFYNRLKNEIKPEIENNTKSVKRHMEHLQIAIDYLKHNLEAQTKAKNQHESDSKKYAHLLI